MAYYGAGYIARKTLKEPPLLYKCPKCGELLVTSQLIHITTEHTSSEASEIQISQYPQVFREAEFDEITAKQLRIRYWQWCNSKINGTDERGERVITTNVYSNCKFDETELDNLYTLDNMLCKDVLEERIMLAEIKRELGLFEEAMEFLQDTLDNPVSLQIWQLAEKKIANVSIIKK